VSSFLTAHQHILGYLVPYNDVEDTVKKIRYNQGSCRERRETCSVDNRITYLCTASGMSITVWCDRSPIYFISTFHDPHIVDSVNRKNKSGEVSAAACPQVVKEYTASMGGCDLNDQND